MKKKLGYFLAGSLVLALTFCKDKDKDETPAPEGPSTPSVDLIAGSNFKSYKVTKAVDPATQTDYTIFLQPCQKAYLYDFHKNYSVYQRKGSPACSADKDTLFTGSWAFTADKDSLIIDGGLGSGKIKEMTSTYFILVKDTMSIKNLEVTMVKQ